MYILKITKENYDSTLTIYDTTLRTNISCNKNVLKRIVIRIHHVQLIDGLRLAVPRQMHQTNENIFSSRCRNRCKER